MDIRLVRGRTQHLWTWTGVLVALAAMAYVASIWLGDPTTEPGRAAGASANFGADRGAVVPVRPGDFESAFPLQDRELGRLLRVRGTAESGLVKGALWVRTTAGRWILMRFEPTPPPGTVGPYYRGARVDVVGYLDKISRAEIDAWLDTLAVYLPRPRPGVKFGDLPDSGFVRVDTLFIRNYYISVRPDGARRGAAEALARPTSEAEVPSSPLAPARAPTAAAPSRARVTAPRPAEAPLERPRPPRPSPRPAEEPPGAEPALPAEPVIRPDAPRDTLRMPP